jgi:ribose-phosphate pyrophosphokinase
MESLNLSPAFSPTNLDEVKFKSLTFNGGEEHIRIDPVVSGVTITIRMNSSSDLMKVVLAVDALRRYGNKTIKLYMPYLPYARQDRQCAYGESFSLKAFTSIINSLDLDSVAIIDAHSDVGPALLNNCNNIPNDKYVAMAYEFIADTDTSDVILISPDSGANKKVNKLFDNLGLFSRIVKCDKKRSTEDGSLGGFEVFSGNLMGATCLIVDDICDGGRTFIGIAEVLKSNGAGNIYLFVTHGIFSNGFDDLRKYFKKIFTTNSIKNIVEPDNFIVQFKCTYNG